MAPIIAASCIAFGVGTLIGMVLLGLLLKSGRVRHTVVNMKKDQTTFVCGLVLSTGEEMEIRRTEGGMLVGIDGSWLEQDIGPVLSPYDDDVELVVPDDEEDFKPTAEVKFG